MNIEIKGIRKSYGKNIILRGIDLDVREGGCIGIIGRNGCGKSTLLTVLAGVQHADSGNFFIDGHDLFASPKDLRKNVGFVPQGTPLIEELSAKDNLLLWYSRAELEKELKNGVLSLLGVEDFLKTRVSRLSGGMKKRLSIGCAMYTRPPVLLLDEPCAALDIECKENIIEYIKDYTKRNGTVILTSHDPMELAVCTKWFIMRDGVLFPYDFDGDTGRLVKSL